MNEDIRVACAIEAARRILATSWRMHLVWLDYYLRLYNVPEFR
jgi:hypothetical protein